MINQKDILNERYPFFALPPDTTVDVKLCGRYITLDFSQKLFTFAHNESLGTVKNTIAKAFKEETFYHSISIRFDESNIELRGRDKLEYGEKYYIAMNLKLSFSQNLKPALKNCFQFDFSSTVFDAKKLLSEKFTSESIKLHPDNIVLFDKEGDEIKDTTKNLKEMQDPKSPLSFRIDRSRITEPEPAPQQQLKVGLCTVCYKEIDQEDVIYYSDCPYHKKCIKCMICNKTCESFEDLEEFKCITQGLFLCCKHYDQYKISKKLPEKNLKEYHEKNKENFIKELFGLPFENDDVNADGDDYFITKEVVSSQISKDRPFEDFIPTAIFKFKKQPQDFDFDKFQELFGDEVVILDAERGCTILKIAFLSIKKLSQKVTNSFENLVNNFKAKLASTIGKPVVSIITVPNDSNIINAYNKPSLNLLQNTNELNSIDIETMKNEVLGALHKEKVKKNWSYIFSHENIFKQIEEQVRKDLKKNEFEMIVVAQTIIANKNIEEYEKIKKKIPNSNMKQVFVYHGSKLANHQKIVKKHFLMPGEDKMEHQLDSGYYGKGIYATENMFYAAKYANSYSDLGFNEKTHVICCMAIYNDSKVNNLNDLSYFGRKIEPEIANNYGINHAFVGSSKGFYPIPETEEEKNINYISANEYVFPSKYQIIPMCSFTLMRKEYFILWKDENIENNENATYLNDLAKRIEVNVYSEKDVDKALDIIRKKKRNKIKLITNGGAGLTGKKLILEARKITKSNFVCLVFAGSPNH